jgi:SNF2 family DNA or RNA helicase
VFTCRYRLDGSTDSKTRQDLCRDFNNVPYEAGCTSLFLISTKAGGQVRRQWCPN